MASVTPRPEHFKHGTPNEPPAAVAKDDPATKAGCVYLLRGPYGGGVKIGHTFHLGGRLRDYPAGCELLHLIFADDPRRLEAHLHAVYCDKRISGEWFRLADADVARLKALDADDAVYAAIPPPPLTEQHTLYFSPSQLRRVTSHGKRRGMQPNAFIRFALDQFMTREEGGR